jgi:hypothetical protein
MKAGFTERVPGWVKLMIARLKWVPPVSGYLFGDHVISKACRESGHAQST